MTRRRRAESILRPWTKVMMIMARYTFLLIALFSFNGCMYSKTWDALSPFQDPGPPSEHWGDSSNKTLLEEVGGGTDAGGGQAANARAALQVMGNYRAAQPAQPTYPVVQPAEVRLMWIPDHLNKNGDLVPAHYYYLKVLDDRWAVQDAFDFESQLNATTKGEGGATPWVYGDTKK
jgi:hypothetical protein